MAMVLEHTPLSGYCEYSQNKLTMNADFNGFGPLTPEGHDETQTEQTMIYNSKRPLSALARGVHITEFDDSNVNPTPHFLEEADILLEQYLSPGKLQMLTGVENLDDVVSLELKVDSHETSLGNFGSLLPNLVELKLSGSRITSIRDLGSSLKKLRVLWLTRCGLEELDGISSMQNLREVYLEYNEICDLSPLSMLEEIETLDLEGNNVDDLVQVQYLSFCPKLKNLALDGNPICVSPTPNNDQASGYNYRENIVKLLPNLVMLDDEPVNVTNPSLIKNSIFDDDWAYLEELQRDAFIQEDFTQPDSLEERGAVGGDRPSTAALLPAAAYRPGSALRPSSGFRPLSASKRPASMSGATTPRPMTAAAPRPVSSDAVEASSELTMGSVICGNPSKALRQRRQQGPGSKEEIRKGLNKLLQKAPSVTASRDESASPDDEMTNILEELHLWKMEHEKRMEAILKTKEAQVLIVDHDGELNSLEDDDDELDDHDDDDDDDDILGYKNYHSANLLLHSKKEEQEPKVKDLNSGGDTTKKKSPSKGEDSYNPSEKLWRSGGDLMADAEDQDDELSLTTSATSAQLMSTLRSRQVESPSSPRNRKLRVGPTGLPLSSQQPVIRNNIVPLLSRAGLAANPRPLSSKANVAALLPSQPRINRIVPDVQTLVPHPPNSS